MLNQTILVGRIVELPNEERKELVVKVPRNYKNEDGVYEDDIFEVRLFDNILNNTVKYCKVNDMVGVKGRLKNEDGKIVIVCEKLTFLSNKSQEDNE